MRIRKLLICLILLFGFLKHIVTAPPMEARYARVADDVLGPARAATRVRGDSLTRCRSAWRCTSASCAWSGRPPKDVRLVVAECFCWFAGRSRRRKRALVTEIDHANRRSAADSESNRNPRRDKHLRARDFQDPRQCLLSGQGTTVTYCTENKTTPASAPATASRPWPAAPARSAARVR